MKLTIIGAGLQQEDLTLKAVKVLKECERVIMHTERIGCADWLKENGIAYESLDALYDTCEDFDEHARCAADHVIAAAQSGQAVAYVVYDVRDRSVSELCRRDIKPVIVAGPPMEGALEAYLRGSTCMLEASEWADYHLSAKDNALIREINTREMASEVKLKLMEVYPEESRVYLLNGDGSVARLPLYDMDRMKSYDHRTCALIPAERDLTKLERFGFDQLLEVMHILQSPDGCPWDKVQTHQSLRPYLIEEAYEVIDAIDADDPDHLYDELGDLLMQIVMHAQIGERCGEFELRDSLTAICRKMIDRHTHIFGHDSAGDPEQVLDLWSKNKMKERGQKTYTETLREVSKTFPALLRAQKLVGKANSAGVSCTSAEVIAADAVHLTEEICGAADRERAMGDALFMLCALTRKLKTDPEIALNKAADRFIARFEDLENEREMPVDEADAEDCWNRVKL